MTIKIEWRKIIRLTTMREVFNKQDYIRSLLQWPQLSRVHLVIQFVEIQIANWKRAFLTLIHLMPLDPFDVSRLIKFILCVHLWHNYQVLRKILKTEECRWRLSKKIKKLWREFKIELRLRKIILQFREERPKYCEKDNEF